ncbi:MOSC N-terminal beta barrel domain-containing protein [Streptomyces sp. IB2014 016-6]|uniref:MOSC domain-containing protein n=1 Tax=Streptomyces sp. IB2014 016-6 TaxID=2517818 RepID=UPI0011C94BAB|nr:MOSC N-terminal beta barrel domain-containing protein [Streptomyces sp. IB2014 016-6]TXL88674.1 MOSC domain-containing protein [Streptomyces sp. IB2014 016-6]
MSQPLTPVLHALRVHPVKSVGGFTADSAVVEPWGLAGDRRWTLIDESGTAVTQRESPRLALARAEPLRDGGLVLHAPGLEPLEVARPATGGARTAAPRGGPRTAEPRPAGPRTAVRGAGVGVDLAEAEPPADVHDVVVDIFGTKVDASLADARASDWFSRHLGVKVRLAHMGEPASARPVDPAYARPGDTVAFADSHPLLVVTVSSFDALNSLMAQGDHADEGPLPMDRFRPNLVVAGTAPWAEDEWRRITVGEVTFRVAKPCGRCVITTTDQRTAGRGKEPLRTLARHRRIDGKLVFGQKLVPENTGTVLVGDVVRVFTD